MCYPKTSLRVSIGGSSKISKLKFRLELRVYGVIGGDVSKDNLKDSASLSKDVFRLRPGNIRISLIYSSSVISSGMISFNFAGRVLVKLLFSFLFAREWSRYILDSRFLTQVLRGDGQLRL